MLIFSSSRGKNTRSFHDVQVCHNFRPCFLSLAGRGGAGGSAYLSSFRVSTKAVHGQSGKREERGWIKPSGQLTGGPGPSLWLLSRGSSCGNGQRLLLRRLALPRGRTVERLRAADGHGSQPEGFRETKPHCRATSERGLEAEHPGVRVVGDGGTAAELCRSHPVLAPVPGRAAGTRAARAEGGRGFKSDPAFRNALSPCSSLLGASFVHRTAAPSQPPVLLTHNIHVYLNAG